MGKGEGKGYGRGECGNSGEFQSEEAKQTGKQAPWILCFEIIGSIFNCCFNCVVCANGGCCLYCWMNVAGWFGIGGASAPVCCCKNVQGLRWITATSAISFVVRFIMFIVLIVVASNFNTELEDYDKCKATLDASSGEEYSDDSYEAIVACGPLLTGGSRSIQVKLIQYTIVTTIITGLWTIVSVWGVYAGWKGHVAESKMPPPTAGVAQGVGAPQVQMQIGGPQVVQAHAVGGPPVVQAQVVQAQPSDTKSPLV